MTSVVILSRLGKVQPVNGAMQDEAAEPAYGLDIGAAVIVYRRNRVGLRVGVRERTSE